MNKEPETYEEIIRKKRCIDLTKYYNLTMSDLEKIYEFLENNPHGEIRGNANSLSFIVKGSKELPKVLITNCTNSHINGLSVTQKGLTLFNKPETSSYSGGSGGSSGFSSNNNNNNNNNRCNNC